MGWKTCTTVQAGLTPPRALTHRVNHANRRKKSAKVGGTSAVVIWASKPNRLCFGDVAIVHDVLVLVNCLLSLGLVGVMGLLCVQSLRAPAAQPVGTDVVVR